MRQNDVGKATQTRWVEQKEENEEIVHFQRVRDIIHRVLF